MVQRYGVGGGVFDETWLDLYLYIPGLSSPSPRRPGNVRCTWTQLASPPSNKDPMNQKSTPTRSAPQKSCHVAGTSHKVILDRMILRRGACGVDRDKCTFMDHLHFGTGSQTCRHRSLRNIRI